MVIEQDFIYLDVVLEDSNLLNKKNKNVSIHKVVMEDYMEVHNGKEVRFVDFKVFLKHLLSLLTYFISFRKVDIRGFIIVVSVLKVDLVLVLKKGNVKKKVLTMVVFCDNVCIQVLLH